MLKLIKFLIVVTIFFVTSVAFSQPSNRPANPAGSGAGGGGPAGGGPSNPRVPIDGGLGILLVAGGIFGAKCIYDNFKEEDTL